MRYLLDTCVISEFTKPEPSRRVLQWMNSIPEQETYLSAITFGEIQKGVAMLPEGVKRDTLTIWLNRDLNIRFNDRILMLDTVVCLKWGSITATLATAGIKKPSIDLMIAATAIIHSCILVTRNVTDFAMTGVEIINPWN